MYNRRYDKIYLMLRQETAGYGLQQKTPWGSCVLEIKNGQARLHITAQGLRPRSRGWYGVYAVAEKDGQPRTFFGGELPISPGGQGELKWDFPADRLGDCQAEDVYAVVVLAREEDGRGLSAPLTAYFGEKREWRQAFSQGDGLKAAEAAVLCPPKEEKTVPEQPLSVLTEQGKEEKTEVLTETKKEPANDGGMMEGHGSFRDLLKKFRQEMEELTEMGLLTEEENQRILGIGSHSVAAQEKEPEAVGETVPAEAEEQPPEKEAEAQEDAGEETTAPEEKTEKQEKEKQPQKESWLLEGHETLYPFGGEEAWQCILPEEALCLGPFYWNRDIFFLSACHRYRHLIARAEGDGLLLGLPEQFREEDRKRAAALGLVWFRPMEQDPAFGYWIGKVSR
ncbi:hypothetical protein H9X85_11080 [Anaerotignum lactatifermentans]|uniref:Uncharacterized protein n=1 Tax=Anaerotignum lactatifermentans TaxID=160404 RepID=A0ABS2GBX1_9FIRM|nr:hypothetical protein [Anaerotignum lactatifermentans]MBM6830090.1 hypothetical protein [Anaerotignum lactatifermentans]MBM6878677.1 hypothetical protein [Anaerotignum lactatifermentans]MBM6951742.1 hypothetical protein [Anaerotignum lactatifermentans]